MSWVNPHIHRCKKKSTAESVLNPSSGDIKLMEITRKVAEDLDGNDNLIKEPRAHTGNLRTGDGKLLWMLFSVVLYAY